MYTDVLNFSFLFSVPFLCFGLQRLVRLIDGLLLDLFTTGVGVLLLCSSNHVL